MGEVYRARDTRLKRDVAVKMLSPELSGDDEHLERFEREAQLLAAVNHPGIAAIYGIEESGGGRYLVLELVPGETLAERLAVGAPSPRSRRSRSRGRSPTRWRWPTRRGSCIVT